MVTFPHCKINLGLNIIRKRDDGYHDIETCFYPVPWCDILEVIPSKTFSFNTSGIVVPGDVQSNLCIRAYEMLRQDFALPPVSMHLHKIIPMGAGLGGGSSDAAFTLHALNHVFDLKLTREQLHHYAAQLGSDCSFFLYDKAMMGEGRGEKLTEITVDLKGKFLVMVKPEVHVSTAEAYAGVKPGFPQKSISDILHQPVESWKQDLKNDFESSVFLKYPAIEIIKNTLYNEGALYASMSGSGSTVFGIFKTQVNLSEKFTGCAYWSGVL